MHKFCIFYALRVFSTWKRCKTWGKAETWSPASLWKSLPQPQKWLISWFYNPLTTAVLTFVHFLACKSIKKVTYNCKACTICFLEQKKLLKNRIFARKRVFPIVNEVGGVNWHCVIRFQMRFSDIFCHFLISLYKTMLFNTEFRVSVH